MQLSQGGLTNDLPLKAAQATFAEEVNESPY